MDHQSSKLTQLRNRAETILKQAIDTPSRENLNLSEIIHELNVYHVELEIQLEDLQQSNHALAIAQECYTHLFDFAPVGYIVTDEQGIVITANLTASMMMGVERGMLEKTAFAHCITTDFQDIYHLYRRAVLRTGQAQTCEVQLQRQDGTIFPAQLNTEVSTPQTDMLRTAITDITALKAAEVSLQRALKDEQQINQRSARVLSVIAHEFRTPLTTILTSVDILDRYGDKLTTEKKQERYQTIRNLIWYLNDTVQDARSIMIQDEPLTLKRASFDILAFTRQIINDMSQLAKEGQTIHLEIETQNEQELVFWDESLVRRVFMNLLSNAISYSQDAIHCRLQCTATTMVLHVQDQGMGISEEDQQHIYEPFYRGKNAEFIHGTGIGLFVIQQSVQAHEGTIDCQSRLGEGTIFIIELPRQSINALLPSR